MTLTSEGRHAHSRLLLPPPSVTQAGRRHRTGWDNRLDPAVLRGTVAYLEGSEGEQRLSGRGCGCARKPHAPQSLFFLCSRHQPDGLTSQAPRDMPPLWHQLQALPVMLGKVTAAWTPS